MGHIALFLTLFSYFHARSGCLGTAWSFPRSAGQLTEPSAGRAAGQCGQSLPGLRLDQRHSQDVLGKLMASANNKEPDEDFFDMLIKSQVNVVYCKGAWNYELFLKVYVQ